MVLDFSNKHNPCHILVISFTPFFSEERRMEMIIKLLKFTKPWCINQGPPGRQKPQSKLNRKSLIYKELFAGDWHIEGLAGKQ